MLLNQLNWNAGAAKKVLNANAGDSVAVVIFKLAIKHRLDGAYMATVGFSGNAILGGHHGGNNVWTHTQW